MGIMVGGVLDVHCNFSWCFYGWKETSMESLTHVYLYIYIYTDTYNQVAYDGISTRIIKDGQLGNPPYMDILIRKSLADIDIDDFAVTFDYQGTTQPGRILKFETMNNIQ